MDTLFLPSSLFGGARTKKSSESGQKNKKTSSRTKKTSPGKKKNYERVRVRFSPEEKIVTTIINRLIKSSYKNAHKSMNLLRRVDYPLTYEKFRESHMVLFDKKVVPKDLVKDFYDGEIHLGKYKSFLNKKLRKKSKSVYQKYKDVVPQTILNEYINALADAFIEGYRHELLVLNNKFWKRFFRAQDKNKKKVLLAGIKDREMLRDKYYDLKST